MRSKLGSREEREMEDAFSEDYKIPKYFLVRGSDGRKPSCAPVCPVLVFINSESGGHLGGKLLAAYRSILNENQVFDLGEMAPDKVLRELYANLETFKQKGDSLAAEIQKQLKIIVAGGDGAAGRLLGVVSDLKLPDPPPIAALPLGTGNNLPFSLGWGKKNPCTDRQSVMLILKQVKNAKEMKIDSWHIIMRMRAPEEGSCDPIAPLELPHSLHAFHRVSQKDELNVLLRLFSQCFLYRNGCSSIICISLGEEITPREIPNHLVNQSTYLKLAGTQGCFFPSLLHPSSRNIAQLAKVKIMKGRGIWEDLNIPRSIKSIICLNLPSFSGGLDPWGKPYRKKLCDRGLTPPYVDDGKIEIVGFRDAWHGLVLLAPNGHATRLAQANGIRFEFEKGAADHTFMRIDGEPWKQPLPKDDDTVVVEISHFGKVCMLATPTARSRSVNDHAPASSSRVEDHDDDDSSSEDQEDESYKDWEERRKFGAADSFKFPDGVDIEHFI